jgi:hypothetical protein
VILAIAPTPTLGRGLSRSKIASALRRGGRQRRVEERALEIQQPSGRRQCRTQCERSVSVAFCDH